jgi:predicted Fe-Mo cluster-binding NifX family protein
MKIAVVSNDERTISQHFGRAEKYIVFSAQEGRLTGLQVLQKPVYCVSGKGKHQHGEGGNGFGHQSRLKHQQAFDIISDCDFIVTRGMGRGAFVDLKQLGIQPIITDIADIEPAVMAVLDGSIINHMDRLH